jgi:signal transduction histidine kinase
MTFGLWSDGWLCGRNPLMAGRFATRHLWIFCVATVAVWLALGWPLIVGSIAAVEMRGSPKAALWLVAFTTFGAAALGAMVPKLRPRLRWALLCVQVAAVMAMAYLAQWAMMSVFLIITAWQVAMVTTPVKALAWVAVQMAAVTAALALAPIPDICWVLAKSLGLQLLLVFTAYALRWESESARALAETNRELRSAQAMIASTARDAERLRISRELHDAWGHELTALGLQLEIASHVAEPGHARDHVLEAKGRARDLLAKVRNVVAALREAERFDLKEALEALAQSVPTPAIHVEIAADVRVGVDQAHALLSCAQEAIASAVGDSGAANLWLQVSPEGDGVRLVARNDGKAEPAAAAAGSRLLGMRERVERLGGRLAVRRGAGFAVDAWLPSRRRQAA